MRKLLLSVVISILLATGSLHAATFEVGLTPVWWQYQEQSEQRAGMASTPFQSKANGYALAAESIIQYDMNRQWLIEGSWRGLFSTGTITEQWQLNGGNQRNQLAINQSEFQVGLLRKLATLQIGAWTSYQWHEQSRKQFISNGVPVLLAGEPIKEAVQTVWAGVTLRYDIDDWFFTFDSALPIWVYTTNDLVSKAFKKRSGYRITLRMKRTLPWHIAKAETAVTAAYQYRVLGNDLKTTALWPKNSWTAFSLGLSLIW